MECLMVASSGLVIATAPMRTVRKFLAESARWAAPRIADRCTESGSGGDGTGRPRGAGGRTGFGAKTQLPLLAAALRMLC